MQNTWIKRLMVWGMILGIPAATASWEEEYSQHVSTLRADPELAELLNKVPARTTTKFPQGLPRVSETDLESLEEKLSCKLPEIIRDLFKECAHLRWELVEITHPKGRYPSIWGGFYQGQRSPSCQEPRQSLSHLIPLMEVPDALAHYCYNRKTQGVEMIYMSGKGGQSESWSTLTDFLKSQLRLFVK